MSTKGADGLSGTSLGLWRDKAQHMVTLLDYLEAPPKREPCKRYRRQLWEIKWAEKQIAMLAGTMQMPAGLLRIRVIA